MEQNAANAGGVAPTPRTARIWHWHAINGTDQPWTRERFFRLVGLLHCEPGDLASVFCVRPEQLRGWLKRGRIPTYFSLHLSLLEKAYAELVIGKRPSITVPIALLHD